MKREPEAIDAETIHHFVNITPSPKTLTVLELETNYGLVTNDNVRCVTGSLEECEKMKHKMEQAL